MQRLNRNRERALILLILALALGLRLWGITFGLPHRYHVDEPYYVLGALRMGNGDFAMNSPQNAPNLWQFILLAEYAALFVVGRIAGVFAQPSDLATVYLTDPSVYYILARVSSAIAGVATVGLTYLIGKRLFNGLTGLVAALLLAVLFLHVRESHFAVSDAFVTLLIVFALYASVAYAQGARTSLLLLGALAIGAAIGMKYRPVVFVVPLVAAALGLTRADPRWLSVRMVRPGLILGVALAAGFLIGYPGVFLNPVYSQVHLDAAIVQAGVAPVGAPVTASARALGALHTLSGLLRLFSVGAGLPMLLAAALGVALTYNHRNPMVKLLAITGLGYLFLDAVLRADLARYLLPLLPPVALFAASATLTLAHRLLKASKPWQGAALAAALVLLMALPPAISSSRYDILIGRVDTRTQAKAWIEENIPPGSRIAEDWPVHGPPLATADDPEPGSRATYELLLVRGEGLSAHPLAYYLDQGFDYVITSSFVADMEPDAFRPFYASLDDRFELIKEFSPRADGGEPAYVFDEIFGPIVSLWQRDRPGPVLKIYRLTH
jgi:4-amino-4-deoxy-L-arabinose transferase-like glycosyltransferase